MNLLFCMKKCRKRSVRKQLSLNISKVKIQAPFQFTKNLLFNIHNSLLEKYSKHFLEIIFDMFHILRVYILRSAMSFVFTTVYSV